MGFVPEYVVFIPIRLRNQIWDKYHFSGTQLWLRAHGSAEKNTTEPGVLGAWTILRDIGTSARNRRVIESTP